MIEPVEFYANEQTAYTNHYQKAVIDETAEYCGSCECGSIKK